MIIVRIVRILCFAGHTYLSADWMAKNRAKFYIENEAKVCCALIGCLLSTCCNIRSFIVVIREVDYWIAVSEEFGCYASLNMRQIF